MSSSKDLTVDGKLLSSLRVVDLKEALEKRGLSKSGTKKDLADRLKQYVLLENDNNAVGPVDEEQIPNYSTREQLAEQNPFLRDYFQSQAELFHSQKVVKKLYEGMTHTEPGVEEPEAAVVEGNNSISREPPTETMAVNDQPTDSVTNEKTSDAKEAAIESKVSKTEAVTAKAEPPTERPVRVTRSGQVSGRKSPDPVSNTADSAKPAVQAEPAALKESNGVVEAPKEEKQLEPKHIEESPRPAESTEAPEVTKKEIDNAASSDESSEKDDEDKIKSVEQKDESDSRSPVESTEQSDNGDSSTDEEESETPDKKQPDVSAERSPEVSVMITEPMEADLGPQPANQAEDVLDYDEDEAEADEDLKSGGDEEPDWKRQGKVESNKASIASDDAMQNVSKEESLPVAREATKGLPKSPLPTENKTRASSEVAMDVEEDLDYGEDDGEAKRDQEEFTWSRRILRLKNRCAVATKAENERKWIRTDRKILVVTSEVLQTFFPDVKPLPESEIRLEEKSIEVADNANAVNVSSSETTDAQNEETLPNIKRKISIIPFEETVKELTPPRNVVTDVLQIKNLTRPFTLVQLKELLQRTGNVESIWVDKIKSQCLAKFESVAEAEETRAALHGINWPSSNPKALYVDYSTVEHLNSVKLSEAQIKAPVEQPKEAKNLPVREWDVGKRPRSRSPGRSKRSNSDERKRPRRSQSPVGRRSPHHERKSRDNDYKEEPQAKALDELFRKTTTTPCLYWLPLTPEQISEKEELRRKRMIERERRIAEMEKLRPR